MRFCIYSVRLLCLVLIGCFPVPGYVFSQEAPPRKIALLVGVGEYSIPDNNLPGPHNDIRLMRQMLIAKYGFRPDNILTIEDRKATYTGIKEAFAKQLIQGVRKSDLALFYFSGHGTLLPERIPGDEPSGFDSALCPYDIRSKDGVTVENAIIDNELGEWIDHIPTKNVIVMLDACNSGTGTRIYKTRSLKLKDLGVTKRLKVVAVREAPVTQARPGQVGKEILLAACKDEEEAQDAPLLSESEAGGDREDVNVGAFTYSLMQVVRDDPTNHLTYTEIARRARVQLAKRFSRQTPQCLGNLANTQRFLMLPNEGNSPLPPHRENSAIAKVTSVQGQTVQVEALAGLTLHSGSLLQVSSPSETAAEGKNAGIIQIEKVSGLTGSGRLMEGAAKASDPLVELYHGLEEGKLRVALISTQAELTDAIKSRLADLTWVQFVQKDSYRDLDLELKQDGNGLLVAPFRNEVGLPAIRAANVEGTLTGVRTLLTDIHAIKLLTDLHNPSPAFHVKLTINGVSGYAEATIGQDKVKLEVETDRDLYLYVVGVDPAGVIEPLCPHENSPENLVHAGVTRIPLNADLPTNVEEPAGLEIVKVFATTRPLNMALFKTGWADFKGSSSNVARQLLAQFRQETNRVSARGGIVVGTGHKGSVPIATDGWCDDDLIVMIK